MAQFNLITNNQYKTIDILHNLLRKNWIREGYFDIDEERQFGLNGLKMLTEYFNNQLDCSKENLIIEEMIYSDINDKFVLCGKLDKVYLKDDGTIETLDYKTSTKIEHSDKFQFDLQLLIYALLTYEKLKNYPKQVSYYYLAYNEKISREVTDDIIQEITSYLFSICKEIENEKEFQCSPNIYCQQTCDYFSICEVAKDKNLIIINDLNNLQKHNTLSTLF